VEFPVLVRHLGGRFLQLSVQQKRATITEQKHKQLLKLDGQAFPPKAHRCLTSMWHYQSMMKGEGNL
jgi:hypothetical protein